MPIENPPSTVRDGVSPVRAQSSSWKAASLSVGVVERLGIGEADPRHDVPVEPGPARQLERRARRDDVQAALGIERIGEREQVVLVGAAAVVEHEQTSRLACGEALAIETSAPVDRDDVDGLLEALERLGARLRQPERRADAVQRLTLTRISAAPAAPPMRAAMCTSWPP